jgi:hypothetical protein
MNQNTKGDVYLNVEKEGSTGFGGGGKSNMVGSGILFEQAAC